MRLKKSFLFLLLIISSLFYIDIKGQTNNGEPDQLFLLTTDSTKKNSEDTILQKKNDLIISALPFALYSGIFGWAAGGFVGIQGLSQKNMSLYMGGLISTNGTKYGFIQFREFYLPFYPRLYIAPDILGGYFGVLQVYKDPPTTLVQDDPKLRAGSNESDKNDYSEVSGSDQWYELKFNHYQYKEAK